MDGISASEIAKARTERRRALLEKFAAGKASAQEIAELGLPDEERFKLEPEQSASRPAAEYAEIFGISPASVYRHLGNDAPLDRPRDLPAWWAKAHPGRKLPEWILRNGKPSGGASPADAASPLELSIEPRGGSLSVDQATAITNLEFGRLQEAYAAGDDSLIATRLTSWKNATEQLRKTEASAQAAGNRLAEVRAEYAEEITTLLTAIATGARGLPQRIARILGADPTAKQQRDFDAEVEALFRRFRQFAEQSDTPPEESEAAA